MAERVEEYRYLSKGVGDMNSLSIGVLTFRIGMFHKVHAKLNAPPPKTGPKLGKRLR